MKTVTILDYGIGNILSVTRAFEYCGAKVMLTDAYSEAVKAERLVLPGVGAFSDGMKGLEAKNLCSAIQEFALKERPFLGICLGMQMMLDESDEFGFYKGLGLIRGRVKKIEETTLEGIPHKIPHIGWNKLMLPEKKANSWWNNTILDGINECDMTYFVHSFTAVPENSENRLADTFYGGRLISAVIHKGYIYGCQFHPEKSGKIGLRIIDRFLSI